jgi:hypothetical protein
MKSILFKKSEAKKIGRELNAQEQAEVSGGFDSQFPSFQTHESVYGDSEPVLDVRRVD